MVPYSLIQKLMRTWNWIRGKRIILTDFKQGRVLIRTGHNSANRNYGGQWYLQRYEVSYGLPPLPRCSRGRLENPKHMFLVERIDGDKLTMAKRWFETRYGALREGQDLQLVCVYDPDHKTPDHKVMYYRPNEIFEIEHPWLSSQYDGPFFESYFGTWYGTGTLKEEDTMDFEAFWEVDPETQPLPKWGAAW